MASATVVALSVGAGGVATAATNAATVTATTTSAATPRTTSHCARVEKRLRRVHAREAAITHRLARLTAAEAKAQRAGKTARVARIKKAIAHEEGVMARLSHSKFMTKANHVPTGACQSAPTTGSSSSGNG